jgi:hypothetical protein
MKRFYFILAAALMMFVSAGSAKADTTPLSDRAEYRLTNIRKDYSYILNTKRGTIVANKSKTGICTTKNSDASTEEADSMWLIVQLENNATDNSIPRCYLFNVGAKKFLTANCLLCDTVNTDADGLTIETNTTGTDGYRFKIVKYNSGTSGSHKTLNFNSSYKALLDSWNTEDDGNRILIATYSYNDDSCYNVPLTYEYYINDQKILTENVDATWGWEFPTAKQLDIDFLEKYTGPTGTVQITDRCKTYKIKTTTTSAFPFRYGAEGTDFKDLYWYRLKIHNKYVIYDEDIATDKCTLTTSLPDGKKSDEDYAFAFIGDPYNGFRIVNYGMGEAYTLSSSNDPYNDNSGGTFPTMKLRSGLTIGTEQGNDADRFFVEGSYLSMKTYKGEDDLAILIDASDVLGYYVNSVYAGIEDAYISTEPVVVDIQESVELTYNHQYNGTTIYSETIPAVLGHDLPTPLQPYGVTVESPTGTVTENQTTYNLNVTYSPQTTGFKFFDSYDAIDTWYKWKKCNVQVYKNVPYQSYVSCAAGASSCTLSYSFNYDDSYLWAAVGTPYSFKIYNKAAGSGYRLSNPNPTISDGDQPTMKEGDGQSYSLSAYSNFINAYSFKVLDAKIPTFLNGTDTLSYYVSSNAPSHIASRMEWTEYEGPVAKSLDDLQQGQVYTITAASGLGSFVYTDKGLNSTYGSTADETDKNQQFMFVKIDGTYYLYSVGGGTFINVDGQRALPVIGKPVNTSLKLLSSTCAQKDQYPTVLSIDDHHVGISNGYDPAVISFWNDTSDEGNSLCIKAVWGVTGDIWGALDNAIAYAKQNQNTALGKYALDQTALSDATALSEERTATIEEVFEAIKTVSPDQYTLNMPDNGQFLRIKDANGNYMTSRNTSSNKIEFAADKDDSSIFCYTGSALIAYKTGYYAAKLGKNPVNKTKVATESTYTLYHIHASSLSEGKYLVSFGGDTRFMAADADAGDFSGGPTTVDQTNYEFTLEEVDSIPVVIGSDKVETLYSPMPLQIPHGVTAFTATFDSENDCIRLTELEDVIPANTGVVIESAADTTCYFAITTSAEGTSCLTGTVPAIATPEGVYTLQNVNGLLGFYPGTSDNLSAFKAYYVNSSGSKGFRLLKDNEPIGIHNAAAADAANGKFYDLQGTPISTPLKHHIYILNGKKVLIR